MTLRRMIRAVTFDCWGTLLTERAVSDAAARGDVPRSVTARVSALVEASSGRLDEPTASDLLSRAWDIHHEAWISGRQFGSDGMARVCGDELGLDDDAVNELTRAFEDAGENSSVEALSAAADTLVELRRTGIRTALVCDTGFSPGRVVRRILERHGLLGHLEVLAFSNEVGVPKPHPQMFRTALDALGIDPTDALHIGDLRRTDVAGARALGMRTVRITDVYDDPTDLPDADDVVGSHTEFQSLLTETGAVRSRR